MLLICCGVARASVIVRCAFIVFLSSMSVRGSVDDRLVIGVGLVSVFGPNNCFLSILHKGDFDSSGRSFVVRLNIDMTRIPNLLNRLTEAESCTAVASSSTKCNQDSFCHFIYREKIIIIPHLTAK